MNAPPSRRIFAWDPRFSRISSADSVSSFAPMLSIWDLSFALASACEETGTFTEVWIFATSNLAYFLVPDQFCPHIDRM
jgi:hypothetical protein